MAEEAAVAAAEAEEAPATVSKANNSERSPSSGLFLLNYWYFFYLIRLVS